MKNLDTHFSQKTRHSKGINKKEKEKRIATSTDSNKRGSISIENRFDEFDNLAGSVCCIVMAYN